MFYKFLTMVSDEDKDLGCVWIEGDGGTGRGRLHTSDQPSRKWGNVVVGNFWNSPFHCHCDN